MHLGMVYIAGDTCGRCKSVHLKGENVKQCMRMGIVVLKLPFGGWGRGKSLENITYFLRN